MQQFMVPVVNALPESDKYIMAKRIALATIGASAPLIAKRIFFKSLPIRPALIASIIAGTTGFLTPTIVHHFKRSDKETQDKIMNKYIQISQPFVKTSGVAGVTGNILKGIGSMVSGAGKLWWKGVRPSIKGSPFLHRAGKFTVRAGSVGGAAYGTKKTVDYINRPRSGDNYTTYLRNRLLAGQVQPNQLSESDLISVKRLGMNQ